MTPFTIAVMAWIFSVFPVRSCFSRNLIGFNSFIGLAVTVNALSSIKFVSHGHYHPHQQQQRQQQQQQQQQREEQEYNPQQFCCSIVTGASGYVGREVVHELLCHSFHPRSIDENNNVIGTRKSDIQHDILCLVRENRVSDEIAYWQRYQQQEEIQAQQQLQRQQRKNDPNQEFSCQNEVEAHTCKVTTIHVLPYDMLDGGLSLDQALHTAATTLARKITKAEYSIDSNATSCEDDLSKKDIGTSTNSIVVYHVASSFGPTKDHYQTALDNVQGTVEMMEAVARFKRAVATNNIQHQNKANETLSKRLQQFRCYVVLTSSMAAVRATGQTPLNGMYYTSNDWNIISKLGTSNWGESYQWSKTESERQAMELSKKYNIPLIALCPSFVFGPSTKTSSSSINSPTHQQNQIHSMSSSYSTNLVDQWLRGESPVQSRLFVDVRDCARAHVAAGNQFLLRTNQFHKSSMKDDGDIPQQERYILSAERRITSQRIASLLQNACLQHHQQSKNEQNLCYYDPAKIHYDSTFTGGAIPIGNKETDSLQPLQKGLGITLEHSLEETIIEMANTMLQMKSA